MKKATPAMIAKLRQDIPTSLLVVAMGLVLQMRRRKAGMPVEFFIEDSEQTLQAFLQTTTVRQLKILRGIARDIAKENGLPVP